MKLKTTVTFLSLVILTLLAGTEISGQGLRLSAGTDDSSGDLPGRRRVAAVAKSDNYSFTQAELNQLEREAVELINQERLRLGLSAIAWSEDAAKIARLHSENMVRFNFFGHSGADGKMVDERADQLGVKKWRAIGENIAFNRGYTDPIATAVWKWMQSTGHRNNLLNPRWQETGIGIAVTPEGCFYFTQVFLERR